MLAGFEPELFFFFFFLFHPRIWFCQAVSRGDRPRHTAALAPLGSASAERPRVRRCVVPHWRAPAIAAELATASHLSLPTRAPAAAAAAQGANFDAKKLKH